MKTMVISTRRSKEVVAVVVATLMAASSGGNFAVDAFSTFSARPTTSTGKPSITIPSSTTRSAFFGSLPPKRSSTCLSVGDTSPTYDQILDVGYGVSVDKPLGIVFGENSSPFFGIQVDDVEPGMNGGAAGIRINDQLLAVNGRVVVGKDFDSVMSLLMEAPDELDLQFYRGNVRSLFTILNNKFGTVADGRSVPADEEDDDDDGEVVVMDESYESPVQIPLDQFQDDDAGFDMGLAMKRIGEKLKPAESEKKEKKKGGGLFSMFSQETIQLDGDDASSVK